MRALVTGGLGFIGSHLVDHLIAQGMTVTVIDNLSTGDRGNANPAATYLEQDLALLPKEIAMDQDYVFHCAALPRIQPSFELPKEHEEANVIGTLDLFLQLRNSRKLKKVVVSSSSAVYGTPTEIPTTEQAFIQPLSPYALQKYATEQYALILGRHYGIPTVALRYFNVYGPRSFQPRSLYNAYSSVIGIFVHQYLQKQPLTVTGDGEQRRDFVHVKDVVRANLAAAFSKNEGEIYNIGTGKSISIRELAETFECPIVFTPARGGESLVSCAVIEKAKKELDWSPQISLQEGIADLLKVQNVHV